MLDPTDILIKNGSGTSSPLFTGSIFAADSGPTVIYESELEALNGNTNILLEATNNITIEDLTDNVLTFQQGTGSITFTADSDNSGAGTFLMSSPTDELVTSGRNINIQAADVNIGRISTNYPDATQDAGSINIKATNGDIIANRLFTISEAGWVGGVFLDGNKNGGDIYLEAKSNVIVDSIFAEAANYGVNNNGESGNAGNVTINAGNNIDVSGITAYSRSSGQTPINLNNTPIFFNVGNGGNVTLNAGGDISTSWGIYNAVEYSSELITSSSPTGELFVNIGKSGSTNINAAGDVNIPYTDNSLYSRLFVDSGTVNSNTIHLNYAGNGETNITSGGTNTVEVYSASDISTVTPWASPSGKALIDVQLGTNGNVNLTSGGDMTARVEATLAVNTNSPYAGSVVVNGKTSDITLDSGGNLTIPDGQFYGTYSTTSGDVNLSNFKTGDINIKATGDLLGPDTTLSAANYNYTMPTAPTGDTGNINIQVGGDVLSGNLYLDTRNGYSPTNISGNAGNITLTAGGEINAGGWYIGTHSSGTVSSGKAGNVTLIADKNISLKYMYIEAATYWGTLGYKPSLGGGGNVSMVSNNGNLQDDISNNGQAFIMATGDINLISKAPTNSGLTQGAIALGSKSLLHSWGDTNLLATSNGGAINLRGEIIAEKDLNISFVGPNVQVRGLDNKITAQNLNITTQGEFANVNMAGSSINIANDINISTKGTDSYIRLRPGINPFSAKAGNDINLSSVGNGFDYGSSGTQQYFPIIELTGNFDAGNQVNISSEGSNAIIYNNATINAVDDVLISANGANSPVFSKANINSINGDITIASTDALISDGSLNGSKNISLLSDIDGDFKLNPNLRNDVWTSDGQQTLTQNLSINTSITTSGINQTVTLQGPEIDINATVDSGTNGTIIMQTSANKKFNIGGTIDNADTSGANGVLDISAPEISRLTANHLEFRNTGNADMVLLENLNLPIDSIKLNNVGNVLLSNKEVSANEAVRILGNYVSGLNLTQFPKITAPLIEITGNQVGSFPAPIGLKATDTNSYVFDYANQTNRGQNYIYSLWPFLLNDSGFDLYPSNKLILPIINTINPFASMMNNSGGMTNSLLNYDNTKAPDVETKKQFKFIYEVDKNKDGIFSTNDIVFEYTGFEESQALDLNSIIPEILKFEISEGGIFDSKVKILDLNTGYEKEMNGKLELPVVGEDTIP